MSSEENDLFPKIIVDPFVVPFCRRGLLGPLPSAVSHPWPDSTPPLVMIHVSPFATASVQACKLFSFV